MESLAVCESLVDPVVSGVLAALHDVEVWAWGEDRGRYRVYPNMVFADYEPVQDLVPLESGVGGSWGPYFALAIGLEDRLGIAISDDEVEVVSGGTFGQMVSWVRHRLENPVEIVGGKAVPLG